MFSRTEDQNNACFNDAVLSFSDSTDVARIIASLPANDSVRPRFHIDGPDWALRCLLHTITAELHRRKDPNYLASDDL